MFKIWNSRHPIAAAALGYALLCLCLRNANQFPSYDNALALLFSTVFTLTTSLAAVVAIVSSQPETNSPARPPPV